jgi:PIN domain nuclease of toxin-antitoxin system
LKETKKFLDSYAIIELLKGNPNYERFSEVIPITSKINLIEVGYHLIQGFPKEKANKIFKSLKFKTIEIEEKQIMKIVSFRKKHSKKKLSYADCIGYVLAKENNLVFVTGDKEFKEIKNVEFVR